MKKVFEYLKHASTYKGIFNLLASSGIYTISPTKEGAITAALIAVVGLIQVFVDDYNVTKG